MLYIIKIIAQRLWAVFLFSFLSCISIYYILGGFSAFLIFLFGFAGIFYNAQDLLLYYPNDPPNSRVFVLQPSKYKLPYESIKIASKDGFMIHLFFVKQSNTLAKPTMLFFHGNAGNMGQRLSNVSEFYHKLNINVLMVEYRGYGLSDGSPSESGIYSDAQAALDYALQRSDIDHNRVILFGRSLGGAVAVDLASRQENKKKIWALIVENTFTSIPDMAQIVLRWRFLRFLPKFVHKNKYPSIEKMGQVLCPTLVLCGSNDALVPPSMAEALHNRCQAINKKLVVIQGGGHDDTWTCRDYYAIIQNFLSNVPALPLLDADLFDDSNKNKYAFQNTLIHTV